MSVEIKICGITDAASLAVAAEAGADLIGLVFFPPSPRALTPETAAAVVRDAPPGDSCSLLRSHLSIDTVSSFFL